MKKIEDVELLPLVITANRSLVNTFNQKVASESQRSDQLQFRQIGQEGNRVSSFILQKPSVHAPLRRKQLQTFTERVKKTRQ